MECWSHAPAFRRRKHGLRSPKARDNRMAQLENAGMTPVADDPLFEERSGKRED